MEDPALIPASHHWTQASSLRINSPPAPSASYTHAKFQEDDDEHEGVVMWRERFSENKRFNEFKGGVTTGIELKSSSMKLHSTVYKIYTFILDLKTA